MVLIVEIDRLESLEVLSLLYALVLALLLGLQRVELRQS
jgi:hypothetical protein